jgi:histidyl-tRNA synthetase
MGDMVMGLVAQKFQKVPALRPSPAEVLVTIFDKTSLNESLRLAAELRAGGVKAEWYPEPAKLDRQLKYADATGVRFAAIVGPDELAKSEVTLKDLANRTQATIQRAQLAAELIARRSAA